MKESSRNSTWNHNHMVIRDSFIKLIERLKKKPTYPEIAKDCGLSESTIQKHIETLARDFLGYVNEQACSDKTEVIDAFNRFCVIKQIHTPQQKATRDAMVVKLDDILKES